MGKVFQEWRLEDGRYLQIQASKWLVDPEKPFDGVIFDAQVVAKSFAEDTWRN